MLFAVSDQRLGGGFRALDTTGLAVAFHSGRCIHRVTKKLKAPLVPTELRMVNNERGTKLDCSPSVFYALTFFIYTK